MKKTYIFYLLSFITLFMSCSDFDEQEFTVLLPNAGGDQIIFTEETGTTIQLNGSGSSDVNNTGFDYLWEIISSPEEFPATLSDSSIASPILEVPFDATGRYELRLSISIGDQIAFDFVNIDTNPANAQILFVNAIDSDLTATLTIPAIDLIGTPVATKTTENTYHNVDTNRSSIRSDEELLNGVLDNGTTIIEVEYNGTIISSNEELEALKSYTLYLVGTEDTPEIHLVEKTRNQNTIPVGLVALDVINLAENTENVVFFVDGTAAGVPGAIPLDVLLDAGGAQEFIGTLNYLDNTEIFLNRALPLPVWATINNVRISNDVSLELSTEARDFGTYMLFPDASSENGNTLLFVKNSELLPL